MRNMQETPEARFAQRFRQLREAAGLSQTQVSYRLRDDHGLTLDPSAVTRIEGAKRAIRLNEAVALASVVGSSLADIAAGPSLDVEVSLAAYQALQAVIDAARLRGAVAEAEERERKAKEHHAALLAKLEAANGQHC